MTKFVDVTVRIPVRESFGLPVSPVVQSMEVQDNTILAQKGVDSVEVFIPYYAVQHLITDDSGIPDSILVNSLAHITKVEVVEVEDDAIPPDVI